MDELTQMYDAVCANPDDDTVRLAFADLLDERPAAPSDPYGGWAAFIRAAIAAQAHPVCARLPGSSRADGTFALRCRCGWCRAHRAVSRTRPGYLRRRAWTADAAVIVLEAGEEAIPARAWNYALELRGGFVGAVSLQTPAFMACAGRLFSVAPVRAVRLIGATPLVYRGISWLRTRDEDNVGAPAGGVLPSALFGLLSGGDPVSAGRREYSHESFALEDLERAALTYGRRERDRLWNM